MSEFGVFCLADSLGHLNVQGDVWVLESHDVTLPTCRPVLLGLTLARQGAPLIAQVSYGRNIVAHYGDIGVSYRIHKSLKAKHMAINSNTLMWFSFMEISHVPDAVRCNICASQPMELLSEYR